MAITKVSSGVISANAVTATIVAENVITSSEIATNGVGTLQIADDAVTSAKLDTNIDVAGTLDVTGVLTADSNVVIAGNLTVNGTTVTNSATNTTIEDALIELGTGTTGTPANDAGIIIERGDSNNAFMGFDESADKFIVATTTATGASTGDLTLTAAPLVTGALTASGLSYPTSDGSANQVIKTDGSGNLSFVTAITDGAVVHNYTATGDGSTTTFDTGINPQDEVNTWVHIDGVYQNKSEYSYNGTSITFSTAPDSGAAIDVITGNQNGFSTADSVLGVYSTTTTDTATYDTGLSASTENNVNIFIEGVYQPKSTYTWSGSTITFDANTPTGLALEVIASKTLTSGAVVTGSITDSAVTTAKIADNAITSAKIVNNSITGADISATTNIVANTFTGALTGNVTGNVTGNLTGTIQTAAQTNITSLGTLSSNLLLGDSVKAIFGAGSDLQIFHDGSNSYIDETGDGVLFIKSSAGVYLNGKTTDEPLARFIENGAVNLYYDNSLKFNTTSTGIDVTGEIVGDGLDITDSASDIAFLRSSNATTSNVYITNTNATTGNTANLYFAPANNVAGSKISSIAIEDFSVSANRTADLAFSTRNNGTMIERMRIDSSGRVGIGTSSPQSATKGIHVVHDATEGSPTFTGAEVGIFQRNYNNAQGAAISIVGGSNSESTVNFADKDDANVGQINYSHSSNAMLFRVNDAERVRIDSSGKVMVGKTSTGLGNAGVEFDPSGQLKGTAANVVVQYLNRTSSDGSILELRKDNTTIGSIGNTAWTDELSIYTSGKSGLTFSTSSIVPTSGTGAYIDNSKDLGTSAYRFKDLYLSGGVFLGGTGSANKLDDYEEGTWSPQVYYQNSTDQANATNVVQDGKYTKIGNLVFLQFRLDFSQSSSSPANDNIGVKNLPFAGANNHYAGGGNVITSTTQTGLNWQIPQASSTILILLNSANVGNFGNEFGTGSNKYMRGSVTYLAQ